MSQDDAARRAAVNAKKPTKADIVALVGEERIQHNPDGTWEANLSGAREMAALQEMTQPWRRAEIDDSGERQGRERDVQVRLKANGQLRPVKESDEARMANRGQLAARRSFTMVVPELPWKKARNGEESTEA